MWGTCVLTVTSVSQLWSDCQKRQADLEAFSARKYSKLQTTISIFWIPACVSWPLCWALGTQQWWASHYPGPHRAHILGDKGIVHIHRNPWPSGQCPSIGTRPTRACAEGCVQQSEEIWCCHVIWGKGAEIGGGCLAVEKQETRGFRENITAVFKSPRDCPV